MDILKGILKSDKRSAARLISMLENGEEDAANIIEKCSHLTGNARIIGITGPSGAGKSTLTDRLAKVILKKNKKAGIIAVDPSSPFSGGAILGDRIRMSDLNTEPGIFIRSMSTRGATGGISKSVYQTVMVMDIFGMDYIIVETVGAGQSEVEIAGIADMVIVVLVPGLGDDIQAMKSGMMEAGDIFVVNKSDKDGARQAAAYINGMLDLKVAHRPRPPVINVTAIINEGIDKLFRLIDSHYDYILKSGILEKRRMERFLKNGGINKMIKKVDHIGLAVSNMDEAISFYSNVLGLKLHGVEEIEEQKVKVAFFPVGDTEIELLEATSADSPIAKFIESKGQGFQHIAYRVDNLEKVLGQMKEKGIRLIDEVPRYGAGGARIAFIHPKSTKGVLIELCERDA